MSVRNHACPGVLTTRRICDDADGRVTPWGANAAETGPSCRLSSEAATDASRVKVPVPTSATVGRTVSIDEGRTEPAKVSTTSFNERLLTAPATMLREGSALSKKTATDESNLETSIVAAIPRLGMPSQSMPTTSARLESVTTEKLTEPSIDPEMNAPSGTKSIVTSKVAGWPWMLAVSVPSRKMPSCPATSCPPKRQLKGWPWRVVS